MDQDSFIKELGRSYIVSSLLPAAFFCLLLLLLFQGFLPLDYFKKIEETNLTVLGQWILMSIIPIWIGFFLFSSVDWVVKLYEGYYFRGFLGERLKEFQRRKLIKRTESYRELRAILGKNKSERTNNEKVIFLEKKLKAYQELQLSEIELPSDEDNIMPTRLGNVLKASEVYALDRYLIESVTIWPRLFPVLPGKFLNDMEEKNNHFMFLLNSSFVIYLASIVSLLAATAGYFVFAFPDIELVRYLKTNIDLPNGYKVISPSLYLCFFIVLLAFGYMLYHVAVNAAEDFSLFYRAGFDLYRMDLLRQLNFDLPKDLDEEKNLWVNISWFLNAGEKLEWNLEDPLIPSYRYPGMVNEKKKKRWWIFF
jgi:hypothetical protein